MRPDPASDQYRQVDDELASGAEARTSGFDPAAVNGDQTANQGQADAKASLAATTRSVDLSKHVEHRCELGGRNTDAVIANGDDRALAFLSNGEPDVTAGICVLCGVGEQVGEHLGEPNRVTRNDDWFIRHIDRQFVSRSVHSRTARVDGRTDDGREIERLFLQVDHASRNARDFEQIVHKSNEVADLAFHDCRHPGGRRILDASQFEQLQSGQQWSKRIAQLVTKCREEFILALVGDAKGFFRARPVRQVPADLILALA